MRHICSILWIFPALTAAGGCATQKETNTPRTGTEQLLISSAVDKALNNFDFTMLRSKQVYLETKYLDCVDKNYVLLALKHRIMMQGALLLEKVDKADIVVEVASGAVGTDVQELFVGIPEIPLPPPSPVAIPKLAFFTRNKLNGTAKLLIVAYSAKTRMPIYPTGMALARSDQKNINVLGAGPVQYGSLPRQVAAADKEMDLSLTTAGNFVTGAYQASPGPFYVSNPNQPVNQLVGPAATRSSGVVPAGYNVISPGR